MQAHSNQSALFSFIGFKTTLLTYSCQSVSICSRTDFLKYFHTPLYLYIYLSTSLFELCVRCFIFFHAHLEIPRGYVVDFSGFRSYFICNFYGHVKTECDSFVCPRPVCLLATSTWQSVPTCGLTALSPSTMEECPPSSTSPFSMEWVWLAGLLTRCAGKIVFLFQRLLLFLASPEITHCLVIKKNYFRFK